MIKWFDYVCSNEENVDEQTVLDILSNKLRVRRTSSIANCFLYHVLFFWSEHCKLEYHFVCQRMTRMLKDRFKRNKATLYTILLDIKMA